MSKSDEIIVWYTPKNRIHINLGSFIPKGKNYIKIYSQIMKVVIISSFFYPKVHPRSFRATELAKEFARVGHQVDVITMNTVDVLDYKGFEEQYSIKISHLNIFKHDGTAVAAGKNHSETLFPRMFRYLVYYLLCGKMFKYTQEIYHALLKHKCLEKADLVIALSTPFYIHYGLSKYIKTNTK